LAIGIETLHNRKLTKDAIRHLRCAREIAVAHANDDHSSSLENVHLLCAYYLMHAHRLEYRYNAALRYGQEATDIAKNEEQRASVKAYTIWLEFPLHNVTT